MILCKVERWEPELDTVDVIMVGDQIRGSVACGDWLGDMRYPAQRDRVLAHLEEQVVCLLQVTHLGYRLGCWCSGRLCHSSLPSVLGSASFLLPPIHLVVETERQLDYCQIVGELGYQH